MPFKDPEREAARTRKKSKASYYLWKLLGLCIACGADRDGKGVRCIKCAQRWVEYHRRDRERVWNQILDHYGAQCSCCGETERIFLTIDHINNDGHSHRRGSAGVGTAWAQIRKRRLANGWPTDIRILCFNCNCGRERNGGVCPHEIARRSEVS